MQIFIAASISRCYVTSDTRRGGRTRSSEYPASGQPAYFALGIGVAGPNGVLAHNNPNDNVLGNLKGLDHLEDSPIGAALFGAAEACGLPVEG